MRRDDVTRLYEGPYYGSVYSIANHNIGPNHSTFLSDLTDLVPDSVDSTEMELPLHHAGFHIPYNHLTMYAPLLSHLMPTTLQESRRVDRTRLNKVINGLAQGFEPGIRHFKDQMEPNKAVLSKIDMINQPESGLILFDLLVYSQSMAEAEACADLLKSILFEALRSIEQVSEDCSCTGERCYRITFGSYLNEREQSLETISINDPFYFAQDFWNYIEKSYNEDSEEKALGLLKTLVNPKQFKMYKEKDYLYIKGSRGRRYKVKKRGMVEVTQKIRGKKTKKYRLCIEPTNNYRPKICPTDEVVAKIKYIKTDEKLFHKLANVFDSDDTLGVSYSFNPVSENYQRVAIVSDSGSAETFLNSTNSGDTLEVGDGLENVSVYINGEQLLLDRDYTLENGKITFR